MRERERTYNESQEVIVQVEIRGHNVPISTILHNIITEQLERAVQRFGRHVRMAELVLSDVNGPRGGGHACRLLLTLGDGRHIVSECEGDSFYAASTRATHRAVAQLKKHLARDRTLGRMVSVAQSAGRPHESIPPEAG